MWLILIFFVLYRLLAKDVASRAQSIPHPSAGTRKGAVVGCMNFLLFTQPSPWTGWVSVLHFCESVANHFSPHPPPYIELSFSSSLCWYIYSPHTSQIQALEEGSARTCVGATPEGPPTLDMRVKVSG